MTSPGKKHDDPGRNPIEVLIEEFMQLINRGEEVSIEEFAAAHPEQAEEIRGLFPTVVAMESYKHSKETTRAGRVSLGPHKPEKLGDYRILRELGRGGMGVVFEALQESLGRHVAVKVLPRQLLLDERQLRRFAGEAKIAAALHHTNIVPIFGTGEQDGYYYYVMQLIRGIGLDEFLHARRRGETGPVGVLPEGLLAAYPDAKGSYWKAVAAIGRQAASALSYAHGQGTLHRDIKPGNLLLDAQGTLWITDFGLARGLGNTELTQTGNFVGTLAYMAPEQFSGRCDERTDIHGLGLTLYELLTGQPAFREADRTRLIHRITNEMPLAPRRIKPDIPLPLETIVLKAIARDQSHRYPDGAALVQDLERFLADRPIAARRISVVERTWLWCGRNPGMARLAMVTMLAVISALAVGWVAYGMTSDALAKEESKSRELLDATRLAESNLDLAMQAFAGIFAEVGEKSGMVAALAPTEGDDSLEPLTQPSISRADARLLQRMSRFYDSFVRRNQENSRLQHARARARRRMADIHLRLGRYDQALPLYRSALADPALYEGLGAAEEAVTRAALHNEIGRIEMLLGKQWDSLKSHRNAKKILVKLEAPGITSRSKFELARTLTCLGGFRFNSEPTLPGTEPSWKTRYSPKKRVSPFSGQGRWSGEKYNRQALALLAELRDLDRDNLDYRFAEAIGYRQLASSLNRLGRGEEAQGAQGKAITILATISRQHPAIDYYRYELGRLYAMAGHSPYLENAASRKDFYSRGREIFLVLKKKHPNNPLFALSLALTDLKLAGQEGRTGKGGASLFYLHEAHSLARQWHRRQPQVGSYRLLLLRIHRVLVPALLAVDEVGAAQRTLTVAQKNVAQLLWHGSTGVSITRRATLLGDYLVFSRLLNEIGEREGGR